MCDASRSGGKKRGFAGTDARSKMMLRLIFAVAALCHPDRRGASEAFIL
jgi:hypothetical protein